LAAGLRPDPLGELKALPRPPSRNREVLLLRGGGKERKVMEMNREGERRGGKGEGREGRGRQEWKGKLGREE